MSESTFKLSKISSKDINYNDLVEKAKILRRDTFNAFVEQDDAGIRSRLECLLNQLSRSYDPVLGPVKQMLTPVRIVDELHR